MEMAQRGELAQLEAQVKEMQSARDREVQIADQRVCSNAEQDGCQNLCLRLVR
jgi:hypothetical protein